MRKDKETFDEMLTPGLSPEECEKIFRQMLETYHSRGASAGDLLADCLTEVTIILAALKVAASEENREEEANEIIGKIIMMLSSMRVTSPKDPRVQRIIKEKQDQQKHIDDQGDF